MSAVRSSRAHELDECFEQFAGALDGYRAAGGVVEGAISLLIFSKMVELDPSFAILKAKPFNDPAAVEAMSKRTFVEVDAKNQRAEGTA